MILQTKLKQKMNPLHLHSIAEERCLVLLTKQNKTKYIYRNPKRDKEKRNP